MRRDGARATPATGDLDHHLRRAALDRRSDALPQDLGALPNSGIGQHRRARRRHLGVGHFEAIPVGPCLLHLRLAQQGDQRHEIGRQRGDSVVGREQGRAIGLALGDGLRQTAAGNKPRHVVAVRQAERSGIQDQSVGLGLGESQR